MKKMFLFFLLTASVILIAFEQRLVGTWTS